MATSFSFRSRPQALARLGAEDFDFLVVGGGVTGTGIARDAAMRGFRVALVEKDDLGSGTSSKSSKLVHGGLRYLEQYDFKLVFEGTSERARLMAQAPHIVRPLPFLFPIFEGASKGPFLVHLGMWLYDAIALFRNYRNHQKLDAAELEEAEPSLGTQGLLAGMLYYDCITDDARLTLENAIAAHRAGACVVTRTRFDAPLRDDRGRVRGAVCVDGATGAAVPIRAKVIIQAAGPWTNDVLGRTNGARTSMVRPTKGVHLVFPREALPVRHAVVMSAVRDGRVVFAIPWEQSTVVGTTDTDFKGDVDQPYATAEDAAYLCETVARYFPDYPVTAADAISTWAGLRPLVREDDASPYDTSREHTIVSDPRGSIVIAGGKLTTYRKMADECVQAAMELLPASRRQGLRDCRTVDAVLPGAEGFDYRTQRDEAMAEALAAGLPEDVAEHLIQTYGAIWRVVAGRAAATPDGAHRIAPGMPWIWAEVDHAVESEMALSLDDVMVRRTHLHFHLSDQGMGLAPVVAARMGAAMGWSEAEIASQLARFAGVVARGLTFRSMGQPPAATGEVHP